MGNSVTVNFLTDHWSEVKKDPETLVKAIDSAMNYGNESMVNTLYNRARYEDSPRPDDWPLNKYPEQQFLRTNYVTVHHFRHADEHQIVYNHRNSSYEVSDFTSAIRQGFLDTESNAGAYVSIGRNIVEQLRDQADHLARTLDEWELDQA